MEKVISIMTVLSNRRVWSMIFGGAAFIFSILNIESALDLQQLGGLLGNIFTAISALLGAGLALWSFLKPKNQPTQLTK